MTSQTRTRAETFVQLERAFTHANPVSFGDALARIGWKEPVRGDCVVDSAVELDEALVSAAGGTARLFESTDAADLKRWVGVTDDELDRGIFVASAARPLMSPDALRVALERDRDAAMPELFTACESYLFGYARDYEGYKNLIERYRAPFVSNVIVLDRLTITQHGMLTIGSLPTTLLVRHLTIHGGGSLRSYVTLRADFETFEKIDSTRDVRGGTSDD